MSKPCKPCPECRTKIYSESIFCRPCGTKKRKGMKYYANPDILMQDLSGLSLPSSRGVLDDLPEGVYDRAVDRFFSAIGKVSNINPFGIPSPSWTSNDRRYAIMNDLHSPWTDRERLVQAVEQAINVYNCDTLILTGDIGDFYNLSRWPKDREISLREELAGVRVDLEYLSSKFRKILFLYGNHDGTTGMAGGRAERYVQNNISRDIRFLVKDVWMDLLLPDLKNIEVVGTKLPHGTEIRWIYPVGKDAVVTHWQLSSVIQGGNVQRLFDWIREWSSVVKELPRLPRFVLTGHTHRGTTLEGHDYKLIENGMFASWEAQEYMFASHGKGPRKPGVYGWCLLVQDKDGNTDLQQSRFIRCDK